MVSLANKFANGRELDPDDLRLKHVISFLRSLGFKLVRRSDDVEQQDITEDEEQVEYALRD